MAPLLVSQLGILLAMIDLLVLGGHIDTNNPQLPVVSALAVNEGRIIAVNQDAMHYRESARQILDLRGAYAYPGFIDSHAHLYGLGESLETLDLSTATSPEQVARLLAAEAAKRSPGEWILGRGWDQTRWPGQKFPDHRLLTRAAPNNPVLLTRIDGHAIWVNWRAMEIAGISAETPDPPGGKVLRDEAGNPTGVLVDRAAELVRQHVPRPTGEQIRRRLERAAKVCAENGLTMIHDAGIDESTWEAYRDLLEANRLPIRVYAMAQANSSLFQQLLASGPISLVDDRLILRAVKAFADGALGSRGAALFEPYADDPQNKGLLLITEEKLQKLAQSCARRKLQLCTHAIGDLAVHLVLNAYQQAIGIANHARFRIEHAQVVHPDDFDLFARLNIIASMQPVHATSDMRWVEARLGPERIRYAYAWQEFLKRGVHLASGSDFPVEKPSPLLGFYAAITRQDPAGQPPGGWYPEHRMTRRQALHSWTYEGAYAAFLENSLGSLQPGKWADLVVLDRDLMTCSPADCLRATVLLTIVGGKVVYQHPQWGKHQ